jgi:nitrogenase molybdenum-cofactor synthesis protein NifE
MDHSQERIMKPAALKRESQTNCGTNNSLPVMRLSDITEDTVFSPTSFAQYPGSHCAFFGVAGMVPLIKNSYALLLGPAICLYNAKLTINLRALTSDPRPDNLLLLSITQEDIIFGAHEKVKQAVIEVDRRYQPEVLFVVTTCTQEIIGEDFDAAIAEIQPEVAAKLLVIHTDNFTCEDAAPGIEHTYLALADLMQAQPVEEKAVNLLGLRVPEGRNTELVHLLESKGIHIRNVIPSYSTPSEIALAPGVQLNIVLEHYALPLAEKMREDFGTEYIYCERPYALDSVETWYRQIAEVLQIDLNQEIALLKQKTLESVSRIQDRFAGKTCALGMQQGRSFDLARLLVNLGMKPVLIFLSRLLADDHKDIQDLLAAGINPLVVKRGNALLNEQLLADLRPDYFIGFHDRKELARLGIEERSLVFSQYQLGFAATEQLLHQLYRPPNGSRILHYKEQMIKNSEGD